MRIESTVTRRSFLAGGTGLTIVRSSALGGKGAPSASERITLGVIGLGPRGMYVLSWFMKEPGVRVVAVCDCFADQRKAGKEFVDAQYGGLDCDAYRFHEQVLDRKDIDAVLIATGDRWHAVLSVLAARAGKDVYCEKPFCLTIGEGRSLVDAVERYGTVWQCGMQRRSILGYQFVVDMVRGGRIGKLKTITTSFGGGWTATGLAAPEPLPNPEVFDYDRWLGQSPWAPFSKARVAMRGLNWNTGGGSVVDMGPHFLDLAQRVHGNEQDLPEEYEGEAVWSQRKELNNVPNTLTARARYRDGVQIVMNNDPKGVRFEGDRGWLHLVAGTNEEHVEPQSALEGMQVPGGHWKDLPPHIRNFVDCVKSRKQPVANAAVAQRAHTIAHCTNICLRLGRKLRWDSKAERFIGDDDANRMLARTMRAPWRI